MWVGLVWVGLLCVAGLFAAWLWWGKLFFVSFGGLNLRLKE